MFFKGWHHPDGSFFYWNHVPSITSKANVQSTNACHAWNDILTEIPRWKVLAGKEFWTGALLTKIFFHTRLGHFHGSTLSDPIKVACTLGDHFAAVASKLSGTKSRLSQDLLSLPPSRLAYILHPGFDFCQQHLVSEAPGVPKRSPIQVLSPVFLTVFSVSRCLQRF